MTSQCIYIDELEYITNDKAKTLKHLLRLSYCVKWYNAGTWLAQLLKIRLSSYRLCFVRQPSKLFSKHFRVLSWCIILKARNSKYSHHGPLRPEVFVSDVFFMSSFEYIKLYKSIENITVNIKFMIFFLDTLAYDWHMLFAGSSCSN